MDPNANTWPLWQGSQHARLSGATQCLWRCRSSCWFRRGSSGLKGYNGQASSASRRAMWKRQVSGHATSPDTRNESVAHISLPNGEQIHDISKILQKHCIKDEQRTAHRFHQQREKARTAREQSNSPGRQPLDPTSVTAQKLTDAPDTYYNTDCGAKKTLQRALGDNNTCRSAFDSTKDRFASTAAYRSSTFASVVKEPFSDPEAIGPGTYRSKKRAIVVKKKQMPTPGYMSKSARFERAQAQVSAVLSLDSSRHDPPRSPVLEKAGGYVQQRPSTDRARGPVLSTTPRFKSAVFPERYVSSKQYRLTNDAPDRFYDISPSCKFSVEASVKSSSFRCSAMVSRASRLSSEAAMVHNTPSVPILSSATRDIGPGAYNVPLGASGGHEDVNFIMMPQHMDRFGLPAANVGFVEARFRRFALDPEPPGPPASSPSPPRRSPRTSSPMAPRRGN